MRLFFVFSLCLLSGFSSFGQEDKSDDKNTLYPKSFQFGVLIHTAGFGADVQFTKQRTVDNLQLIDISAFELRASKEILLPNPLKEQSRSYVFGKINNLVGICANYGTRRVIADRFIATDIKVNFDFSVGPIIGWLKPMYYEIDIPTQDPPGGFNTIDAKFDPNNTDNQKNTLGYSKDLFKGINESAFLFGGNLKTGLSFEWGKKENKYYSIETGVMVDAFPVPVPIFATIKNDQVFINLFICFTYGIRS